MSSPQRASGAGRRTVSLVTLGCARNEVDSEELAGRLEASGWTLTDRDEAAVVLVNTCGFIEAAKQESIAELLDGGRPGAQVVAAGCLAERYGSQLAEALPEAEVLSFDDYGDIGARLDAVLAGERRPAHQPRDRRRLLPISPVRRPGAGAVHVPGHGMPGAGSAIPAYRGAFLSRPPEDVLAEAEWLAGHGVRELLLVSENSTSYGKDLGNLRLLDELLPALAAVPGIARIRVTYLQPAEMRPGLIEVMTTTPGVMPYFDLSFQHASGRVLRAMRRFGDRARFGALLDQIRQACPQAGARSNFIVGFPGESADDLAELERFLGQARLDAIGIFGYSDEDGTEAASLGGQLDQGEIARRADDLSDLAEEMMAQRAADRRGETVDVLIEEHLGDDLYQGRAAHQAPEVDGVTTVRSAAVLGTGDIVSATVVASEGVDLVAEALVSTAAGATGPR